MSTPPPHGSTAPAGRPRTGQNVAGILLLLLGLLAGCCGLGILAYGGLGAVMVHEAGNDPWVVWSLVVGAVVSVLAIIAVVVGVVVLMRPRR